MRINLGGPPSRKVFHRTFSGLAIIWLVIFYPLACDIHGVMFFHRAASPGARLAHAAVQQHAMPPPTVAAAEHQPGAQPHDATDSESGGGTINMRLRSVPVGSTAMSSFALALPPAITLDAVTPLVVHVAASPHIGHQRTEAPPIRPPRTLL